LRQSSNNSPCAKTCFCSLPISTLARKCTAIIFRRLPLASCNCV
jgi:hypothetical protein